MIRRMHASGASTDVLVGVLAVGALAACSTPTPSIVLTLSNKDEQKCPSTDCGSIALPCRTVMSVRIIDRDDPATVYHSQCTEVPFDTNHTMCSLGRVELEAVKPIPVTELVVEVALYPASVIPSVPGKPNELQCPAHVMYSSANGFPEDHWPTPALGGRSFYHPGDPTVTVMLGCTDLKAIEQSCATSDLITVTATVDDFETLSSVSPGPTGTASLLTVSVGEPRRVDGTFVLKPGDSRPLDSVSPSGVVPTWQSDVDLKLHDYVCIDVVESVAQTTAVVRCRPMGAGSRVDATGMWISRLNVEKILSALSPPPLKFPDEGLTIGVVVDQAAIGIPGMIVTPAVGTVRYLTGQGMLSAASTSSTGIFVSRDAPFGTMFETSAPGRATATGVGGMVAGKLTVVVLQVGSQQP